MTVAVELAPLRDEGQLRAYIDAHWARDHVLARDADMTRFTYATPWVPRDTFPQRYSVLGVYDGRSRLLGFLGAIVAPYPRPQSYWLALWHVHADLKGTGMGGKLLAAMQEIALASDGWIGTFGAGPEALPVYLKRGYLARAARRWIYDPEAPSSDAPAIPLVPRPWEVEPDGAWFAYRYDQHPRFEYERVAHAVFRSESNDWGRVTHVAWLRPSDDDVVRPVYERERQTAERAGIPYLCDAWGFTPPGPLWRLAPSELPSVFHPVEARGNTIFAVGLPDLLAQVHKGDCDQDRPN